MSSRYFHWHQQFQIFPLSRFTEYHLSATCWCSISIFQPASTYLDSERIIALQVYLSEVFGTFQREGQRGTEKHFQLIKLSVPFSSANARTSIQLEQLYTDFYVGANDRTHSALRLSNRSVYESNKDHAVRLRAKGNQHLRVRVIPRKWMLGTGESLTRDWSYRRTHVHTRYTYTHFYLSSSPERIYDRSL